MKKITLLNSILLAGAGTILLSGCVVRERAVYRPHPRAVYAAPASQEVVVTEAPPAPFVEVQTVSPGPRFVWIGGAWVWHGHWVWEHGRWARPPHPGQVWHPHHYEYRNGVHVFIRGGWGN